jgi:hypothetical protein
MAATARKTALDILETVPGRTEDGIELTDGERLTLAQAEVIAPLGEKVRAKDLQQARRLRQTVARSIARKREQASLDAGLAESAALAARDDQVLIKAGGYVRLPKADGVLTLFQAQRLTPGQVRAAVAYRELFYCVERSGIRLSTDERKGGSGLPGANAVAHMTRPFRDARNLAIVKAAVMALDTDDDDSHVRLLDEVVRHGLHLRHVVGAGRPWERGLARLRKVLDLIHRLLGLALLTGAER